MSDFINIRVTEAELDLITCLLEQAGTLEDSTGQPAFELLHDLMEQAARPDDWTEDLEPTEIGEELFELSAEAQMIQAGIDSRAQVKASRRAAERRRQAFGEFDVSKPARRLSETQRFDLWADAAAATEDK